MNTLSLNLHDNTLTNHLQFKIIIYLQINLACVHSSQNTTFQLESIMKITGQENFNFIQKQIKQGKIGGVHFSETVGICLFIWTVGRGSFIWGQSQLGILPGGHQYQFLAQLANAGPKSVEVNLTNCQRSFQNQDLSNYHF